MDNLPSVWCRLMPWVMPWAHASCDAEWKIMKITRIMSNDCKPPFAKTFCGTLYTMHAFEQIVYNQYTDTIRTFFADYDKQHNVHFACYSLRKQMVHKSPTKDGNEFLSYMYNAVLSREVIIRWGTAISRRLLYIKHQVIDIRGLFLGNRVCMCDINLCAWI